MCPWSMKDYKGLVSVEIPVVEVRPSEDSLSFTLETAMSSWYWIQGDLAISCLSNKSISVIEIMFEVLLREQPRKSWLTYKILQDLS